MENMIERNDLLNGHKNNIRKNETKVYILKLYNWNTL